MLLLFPICPCNALFEDIILLLFDICPFACSPGHSIAFFFLCNITGILSFRMRQIFYPLILAKMIYCPRNLSDLVHTGTRIYNNYGPVKFVSSECCKRNRNSPHRHGQTVHIKHCISAGTKHSIDCNFIDGTSDHVNTNYNEHSFQVSCCLRRQFNKRQNKWCGNSHQDSHDHTTDKGNLQHACAI